MIANGGLSEGALWPRSRLEKCRAGCGDSLGLLRAGAPATLGPMGEVARG